MQEKKIKIAAIGDTHVTERSVGMYQTLFQEISSKADILLLCGDLTDHGLPHEAEILKTELHACTIPKIAVLGNHDHNNNQEDEIREILRSGEVVFVEDEAFVFQNIGFTGVKGFSGGYGKYILGAFGEKALKVFVDEAIAEAEMLERNITRIENMQKIVVLSHYSPTPSTLKGESPEIFPFLGTSRLEEVIDRYDIAAAFHGHAHYGTPEGKTLKNTPVYNVAYPLMQKTFPDNPYRLVEL